MIVAVEIRNRVATVGMFRCRILTDDGFSMASRQIQNIGRLAKAGDTTSQSGNDTLTLFYIQSEVAGTGRQIGVVEVVGLDPHLNEGAHELCQD